MNEAMDALKDEFDIGDKKEETKDEVVEEEQAIPEDSKQTAQLIKNQLFQFLEPLPSPLLKDMEKFAASVQTEMIDFAMIQRDLPIFFTNMKNHFDSKKERRNLVTERIVKLIDDFHSRVDAAERRQKDLDEQLAKERAATQVLRDEKDQLMTSKDELWRERMNDPMLAFTKKMVNELPIAQLFQRDAGIGAQRQGMDGPTMPPVIEHEQKDYFPEPEPEQPEQPAEEEQGYDQIIMDLIKESLEDGEDLMEKDIIDRTDISQSTVNRIVKRLMKGKFLKKNTKKHLKLGTKEWV